MIIRVEFQGKEYVWLKNADGTGALAYLSHIDKDGHVRPEAMLKDSFAHVFPDGIYRYSRIIGTIDDLRVVANAYDE